MAISRVTTWASGNTLTAAALNGEFNNILDNALSLISPLTANLNVNNYQLTNVRVENLAAIPTAAQAGRVWFNTVTNQVEADNATNIYRVPTITSVARGDVIYASAASQWARLAVGASAGQVLESDATDPRWSLAGTGTTVKRMEGVLSVSTTAVGNVDAGEDDLQTATLAANTLVRTGAVIHIDVWGRTANNANAKNLVLYFGTAAILTFSLAVSVAGVWHVQAAVVRTALNTQRAAASVISRSATATENDLENVSITETETAAITVKTTGSATTTNDIVADITIVRMSS